MSRREGGGRGRGGGGYYSSRGRGKKLRGGRGSCRIATAEEVEARNAELSRCAAAAATSSSSSEGEEEEECGRRGDSAAAAAGSSGGAAKGSSSSDNDSDNDNRERGGRGGKQMKFKRPLDFLRQQRKEAGEDGDDSTSEDDDDELSTSMGKLKVNQGPQLTRREREAIEQQRRQRRYEKLHAEGKTPEAKADLARLAEVRRRREEAARLRAEGGG